MDDVIITVEDLRYIRGFKGTGYCMRGARLWATSHGIDFRDFIKNGVSASQLLETNDEIAAEFVRDALAGRERQNG